MGKQISPCTLSSYGNVSEWQIPSARNCNSENEPHSNPVRHRFLTSNFSNVCQDSSIYYDYVAAGDMSSGNTYLQNTDGFETIADDSYMNYDNSRDLFDNSSVSRQSILSLNPNTYQNFSHCDYSTTGDTPSMPYFYLQNMDSPQSFAGDGYVIYDDSAGNPIRNGLFSGQSYVNTPYALPIEDVVQCYAEPIQQCPLQYGIPTVTNYGTVALLLRHLIRVDLTADGSVSVNNFPAMSVATLNVGGNKCYVKHPNGLVFQDKRIVHMMAGNNRLVKFSRRGATFSNTVNSLAYNVDESGTKTTTTAKFKDLRRDLTMDIFYDINVRNSADLEQQSHKMVSEAVYKKQSDGSELWELGKIRISQDKWGEVSVTQTDSGTTVTTSPTIRRMAVKSPSISVTISCYSKNYFNVKQNSCSVTSGFCGLIVRNQSQKAGLDRFGKLVLF